MPGPTSGRVGSHAVAPRRRLRPAAAPRLADRDRLQLRRPGRPIAFLWATFVIAFAIVLGAHLDAGIQALWPAPLRDRRRRQERSGPEREGHPPDPAPTRRTRTGPPPSRSRR